MPFSTFQPFKILVNYLQVTVGCEETFSQVCSNLNNLSSEVRELNVLKTVTYYNYLDDLKRLVKSLPLFESDLKFATCKKSERLERLVV